jgi:hypothetical protein
VGIGCVGIGLCLQLCLATWMSACQTVGFQVVERGWKGSDFFGFGV